jgi:hypothetical protein
VPHSKSLVTLLGILGTLAACEALAPPGPIPDHAHQIEPPAEYRGWWSATELCSDLTGRFEAIEWYVVPGASTIPTESGPKVGVWSRSSAGTRIVLAGNYAGSELVVRHEMLHALLDRGGHPPEYFEERCRLTWETWGGE